MAAPVSLIKNIVCIFVCTLSVVIAFPVQAADDDAQSQIDSLAIVRALNMSADQEAMKKELIQDRLIRKIDSVTQDLKRAKIQLKTSRNLSNNSSGPLGFILDALKSESVTSEFNVVQVDKKLKEVMAASASGHKSVENVVTGGDANPYAGTGIQADASLWQLYEKQYCNPYSANATEECAAKKDSKSIDTQNFIDFFIGDKTWDDASVVNALVFARRFFVGSLDKIGMGSGVTDSKSFFARQSSLAQSNLKMAILTDLAARRAPTSTSSQTVLGILLKTLVPTGQVASLNYAAVCAQPKLTPMEVYVCSFTSKPKNGAPRIISQAAIDKIMQYDFMLSSDFYESIYSPDYSSQSIERVEAVLKAQQLVQDYRALRLLQMKTATTAMNIMNSRKR